MIQLRTCQVEAVKKMKNGCILCGDVGSGKSRTALAYYYKEMGGDLNKKEYVRMRDKPLDLYIITTAKKRDDKDWEKEMAMFMLSPYEETKIYDHKIIIDSWNNIQKYKDVRNAFFIFDEDKVTGYGPWVKAFLKIANSSDNRWILLSATPGDKYEDYMPVFIANGFYKNKTEFERRHLRKEFQPAGKYWKTVGYRDFRHLDRLIAYILVDIEMIRHTVQHHEDIWCEYDILKYKDICRKRWNPWENKPIENVSEFCQCLRRVCNEDLSRQVKLLELLEVHNRAIIFYNYDYELEILRKISEGLHAMGVECAEWNGHFHQQIPDSERWIYLVQYNAGAEGWNCISCNVIIFWSMNYSYKTLIQACGRIDRMNTPFSDLYYYHFKSKSSIDLAIFKSLLSKKKFNEKKFVG